MLTPTTNWVPIDKSLPALDEIVWLWDGKRIWIGGRADDCDGWFWANTYNSVWFNGVKWDGYLETDDDYKPTHWMRLPFPPAGNGAEAIRSAPPADVDSQQRPCSASYPLFKHMLDTYNLTLVEDELQDIIAKADEARRSSLPAPAGSRPTREPASEAPVRCSDMARRLRDLEQYVDACDEAADWIEAAGKAILLYEKAVQLKCTCETACGDMVIAARNLTGIEPTKTP